MTTPLSPGWYPDPNGRPERLYWDGQQWHTAPPPVPLAPSPQVAHVVVTGGANNGLHFVLTLLTCGLWLPVWLIVALVSEKKLTKIDSQGNVVVTEADRREMMQRIVISLIALMLFSLLWLIGKCSHSGDETGGSSSSKTTVPTRTQLQTAVTPAPPPPTPATPTPPVLHGVDGEFIAAMRDYGVPVSEQDPQWTIDQAGAICAAAEDNPPLYPPGTATVLVFIGGLMKNNPDWTRQQATRFTNVAVDYYCPWLRGPSQQEIAAMPPDQRYLAMLQDRLGITPTDNGVSLINAARQWCSLKAQGWGNSQVTNATTLSGNDRKDLPEMVEIAIDVYCPEFSGG